MTVSGTEIKEGKTSPPKHFTEDTLLSAMETAGADEMPDEVERKGLGTPATRAGIIEKLVRIGFLERKGDKKNQTPDSDPQGYGSGNSHAGTDSVPIHDGGLGRKIVAH